MISLSLSRGGDSPQELERNRSGCSIQPDWTALGLASLAQLHSDSTRLNNPFEPLDPPPTLVIIQSGTREGEARRGARADQTCNMETPIDPSMRVSVARESSRSGGTNSMGLFPSVASDIQMQSSALFNVGKFLPSLEWRPSPAGGPNGPDEPLITTWIRRWIAHCPIIGCAPVPPASTKLAHPPRLILILFKGKSRASVGPRQHQRQQQRQQLLD